MSPGPGGWAALRVARDLGADLLGACLIGLTLRMIGQALFSEELDAKDDGTGVFDEVESVVKDGAGESGPIESRKDHSV